MFELRRYVTASGRDVFGEWLAGLADARARAKVAARLARVQAGNYGDCKPVGGGVWELRVDWGPGYRLYYARAGRSVVLLLCGGDKRTQTSDITRALEHWNDYKRRMGMK
ncbi:MAG: type II toxin-antitoxin system RelE/ParE family toxin [Planctomycetota bacterium]